MFCACGRRMGGCPRERLCTTLRALSKELVNLKTYGIIDEPDDRDPLAWSRGSRRRNGRRVTGRASLEQGNYFRRSRMALSAWALPSSLQPYQPRAG